MESENISATGLPSIANCLVDDGLTLVFCDRSDLPIQKVVSYCCCPKSHSLSLTFLLLDAFLSQQV